MTRRSTARVADSGGDASASPSARASRTASWWEPLGWSGDGRGAAEESFDWTKILPIRANGVDWCTSHFSLYSLILYSLAKANSSTTPCSFSARHRSNSCIRSALKPVKELLIR
eukprot:IDg5592t1